MHTDCIYSELNSPMWSSVGVRVARGDRLVDATVPSFHPIIGSGSLAIPHYERIIIIWLSGSSKEDLGAPLCQPSHHVTEHLVDHIALLARHKAGCYNLALTIAVRHQEDIQWHTEVCQLMRSVHEQHLIFRALLMAKATIRSWPSCSLLSSQLSVFFFLDFTLPSMNPIIALRAILCWWSVRPSICSAMILCTGADLVWASWSGVGFDR